MKRIYFLVTIGMLQIVVGSLMTYGAAEPVRISESVFIETGTHYNYTFSILGAGRVSGNVTELQSLSINFQVFDDRGYAGFLDGTNSVPPLYTRSGADFPVSVNLSGAGTYHVVIDNSGSQQLQVRLTLIRTGLKTSETILSLVVLVGGLALVGASLLLSVWSWRYPGTVPPGSSGASIDPSNDPSSDPSPDPFSQPSSDPPSNPPGNARDPSQDDTRIY